VPGARPLPFKYDVIPGVIRPTLKLPGPFTGFHCRAVTGNAELESSAAADGRRGCRCELRARPIRTGVISRDLIGIVAGLRSRFVFAFAHVRNPVSL
jgi:hypothetical protein